jgi:cellulose synthase/poly-beta-1,6-N-acetylglucosamine synthase-like glycosyltransferase
MTAATLFIIMAVLYCAQGIVLIAGLKRAVPEKAPHYEPRVSVITAARNEESNIEACLESLLRIEYPRDKFEIIVVDDNSTDATLAIVRKFAKENSNLKVLSAKQEIDHLRGKANAIAQGIDISSGEIIAMTDADCVVPPTWLRSTVRSYTGDVGVVAGLTLLQPTGWFAGMQSLDWAYILAVASAAMALKNPLSCIGNNFSFRKKAYDEIGGYRKIKFSVTEDFALFKAITHSGRWEYRYPFERETLVFSIACSSVRELYRQKRRWGVGGKDMPPSALMMMVIAFCFHALLLFGIFVSIDQKLLLLGLLGKVIGDLVLLSIPLSRTRQLAQLKYFWLFELYFMLYVLLLPFAVFLGGRVVWKGRKF